MAGLRKQSKLFLLAFAGLSLLIFLISVNHRWSEQKTEESVAKSELELDHVRIAMKWSFAGTMAPYFAAQSNGVFEENQIKVDLVESGPGKPSSIQEVILGRSQFGITGAHEIALSRSQDLPVISLAVIFKDSPVCLITTKDRRIEGPADLVGKTVEMTSGDNAEFEYLAMLREAGVDPESVNQVPWQYSYQGLLAGNSDAIVAYENDQPITLNSEFVENGKEIDLICPRNNNVTPYADVLFTTQELIERNPHVVGRVVESILDSWEWANTRADETVRLFLESPQIDSLDLNYEIQLAVLRKSLEFVKGSEGEVETGAHISKIGIQDIDRWAETVDLLVKYGSPAKEPEPESLFTNRWVQRHEIERRTMDLNG